MWLLIAILGGYMTTALMEYLLHRYYLHRNSGHPHISEHHVIFHGKSTYENLSASHKDIVSNPGYIIVSWLPCLISALVLYRIGIFYVSIWCTTGLLYLVWLEVGHYLFHKPQGYFIEDLKLFKKIKNHHKIHHTYYLTNFGIGSSFWDYILGTKKN